MASANLNLVRSIFAAWERGDFSSAEWAHPDVECTFAEGPDPRSSTGLAGMAESMRAWVRAWEDFRVQAEEFRELDAERVLVLTHLSARGKTSGLALSEKWTQGATLWHVSNGWVTRLVIYHDRKQGFVDVGLAPEGGSKCA
jgi:ketosteroid isomerase-like protein